MMHIVALRMSVTRWSFHPVVMMSETASSASGLLTKDSLTACVCSFNRCARLKRKGRRGGGVYNKLEERSVSAWYGCAPRRRHNRQRRHNGRQTTRKTSLTAKSTITWFARAFQSVVYL